mmetsp:Transcript_13991/g.15710  ORF Transcript_13991/g.15710 Transcript_13991/m.15710 type:complete len:316 (-) Transcript_13991:204-1151(-)
MKWEKTEERGVQCKARASKSKMKADRECEGGVKVSMHVGIGAQDLAESVSTELRDMQSNMVPDPTSLLLPEETMAELMSYDDTLSSGLDVFGGEECSEEGNKTCQKELQFGGYFKLFWGCNVTLSKEGRNMRKDVTCGGKSYEGLGKKEDMLAVGLTGSDEYYYDYTGDWVEIGMTVGKGVKCKTNKTSKECEGGVKKDVRVRLGAEDLAQDISTEIRHMHANSVISAPKSLLIPDETMQELRSWDEAAVVTGLDFVDKKVEFGGYANLFWGCTITFRKKGTHLSKELGCGFKGSQRMGKKEDSEEDQETKKKQV